MENTINDLISKYREIHSHLMDEYSKGNANNEIMKMYRSRMSSILGFISDLKRLGEFESVRPEVVVPSEAESIVNALVEWSLAYPRDRVYHVSKMSMDNELIALEERAKKYFTELNHEK